MLLPLLVIVSATPATQPAFSLRWDVPCAAAPELEALVGESTGSAAVEVVQEASAWRLVVRFLSPSSSNRRMKTKTCEEAAQAAALLIRLGARGQPPPRRPMAPAVPPPAEAPELEMPSPPGRISIALGALVQQGPLPSVAGRLGFTIGVESAGGWMGLLSLRVGGLTFVPVGPTPESLVVVQPIVGGQLSMCWQARAGRFSGGPCAAVGAEGWRVRSVNVSQPGSATGAFVGAGLDARGAVRLWEGLSLFASVGGRGALVRPSVFFRDSGTVFEAGAFSAEAELGVRWAW